MVAVMGMVGMVAVIVDTKTADGAGDDENYHRFLFCVPQGFSQISWWSLGSLSSGLYTSHRLLQEVLIHQHIPIFSSACSLSASSPMHLHFTLHHTTCVLVACHPPTPAGSFSLAQPRKGQDPLPSFSFPSPHCTYQPF